MQFIFLPFLLSGSSYVVALSARMIKTVENLRMMMTMMTRMIRRKRRNNGLGVEREQKVLLTLKLTHTVSSCRRVIITTKIVIVIIIFLKPFYLLCLYRSSFLSYACNILLHYWKDHLTWIHKVLIASLSIHWSWRVSSLDSLSFSFILIMCAYNNLYIPCF